MFAGCVSEDGYTHDAQCVVYRGPDPDHQGRQICLNSNENTLTIVDVTDKLAPEILSQRTYLNAGYTHQGWLTDDQRHFLLGDELDEVEAGVPTTTYIFDVSDLDAPGSCGRTRRRRRQSTTTSTSADRRCTRQTTAPDCVSSISTAWRTGACARWRISTCIRPTTLQIQRGVEQLPVLPSGTIIVNGIEQGLFVLRQK